MTKNKEMEVVDLSTTPVAPQSETFSKANDNWLMKLGTDALLLGALSAIGYCIAFAYEMGYAKHFGYPSYLISPTPSVIVIALAVIAATVSSATPIFSDYFNSRKGSIERRVYFWILFFVFIFVIIMYSFTISNYSWISLFKNIAYIAFICIIVYFQIKLKKGDYSVNAKFNKFAFLAVGISFVYLISILAGIYSAKSEKVFYFLTDKPDYAVVRLYDATGIAVRYDSNKKSFDHHYYVIKINDDGKGLALKRVVLEESRLPVALN